MHTLKYPVSVESTVWNLDSKASLLTVRSSNSDSNQKKVAQTLEFEERQQGINRSKWDSFISFPFYPGESFECPGEKWEKKLEKKSEKNRLKMTKEKANLEPKRERERRFVASNEEY